MSLIEHHSIKYRVVKSNWELSRILHSAEAKREATYTSCKYACIGLSNGADEGLQVLFHLPITQARSDVRGHLVVEKMEEISKQILKKKSIEVTVQMKLMGASPRGMAKQRTYGNVVAFRSLGGRIEI